MRRCPGSRSRAGAIGAAPGRPGHAARGRAGGARCRDGRPDPDATFGPGGTGRLAVRVFTRHRHRRHRTRPQPAGSGPPFRARHGVRAGAAAHTPARCASHTPTSPHRVTAPVPRRGPSLGGTGPGGVRGRAAHLRPWPPGGRLRSAGADGAECASCDGHAPAPGRRPLTSSRGPARPAAGSGRRQRPVRRRLPAGAGTGTAGRPGAPGRTAVRRRRRGHGPDG